MTNIKTQSKKQSGFITSGVNRWFYNVLAIALLTLIVYWFHEAFVLWTWLLYTVIIGLNIIVVIASRKINQNFWILVHFINVVILSVCYVPLIWTIIALQSYQF